MLPNYVITVQTPPWAEPRFRDYRMSGVEFNAALRAAKKAASRHWRIPRTALVAPFVLEIPNGR